MSGWWDEAERLGRAALYRARTTTVRLQMELRFRELLRRERKNDVAVIGLRRSGNHAIIEWLIADHLGPVLFLNEAYPATRPNRTRQREWNWRPGEKTDGLGAIVYNYEDQSLLTITMDSVGRQRLKWLGPAVGRFDLLILRDPFNMLASRLQWKRESLDRLRQVVGEWKIYAGEWLGDTATLHHKVPVSFNRWASDDAYRAELAQRLGLAPTDMGKARVSTYGGGSSFDGTAHDGQASQMKVLDRWQRFADDPRFRALVADAELHDLAERAFGLIPGTQALRP